MSNFSFLRKEFPTIYSEAVEAEKHVFTAPRYCALLCRSAMEQTIHWLYEHDNELTEPYNTKLSFLIHEQCFKDILKPSMFREINVIRLNGNNAAHGKKVSTYESLVSLKNLFRFLSFLSTYYSEEEPFIPPFDEESLPDGKEQDKTQKELEVLADTLNKEVEKLKLQKQELEEKAKENELLKKQIEAQKQTIEKRKEERKKVVEENKAIPILIPETATRKIYIDLLLKEAGWDNLKEGRELEFEVRGMPLTTNPSGIGYVDYVLWGKDGLPLAVVEAKKTMLEARKGKYQAELYANCLQEMTGQRPVIFYTNGFETHIWDDTFYPDRPIMGFYTKDELQLLIDRRRSRKNLRNFTADTTIAGRAYQLESIQRVAEHFVINKDNKLKGKSRKSLLVMATGSGKTRTAAAIVDMLTRCNWVKRVLFLADRNALVTQAKNAFKDHLPNLSAIDLTKEKEDPGTRLVFSTYPTIMNKIDGVKTDDNRFYGVGHFDLVIIDEAHRSVYQKYKAIFDYFDSLLLGLTATPKKDVDRNTYSLFDIEDDDPTFAYELNEAVNDGFLVPPKAIEVPIKFPVSGAKYKELAKDEQEEYEEKFGDPTTGYLPDELGASEFNSWVFNTDTVDKVLAFLMKKGIKVEGGDKLGKTIIFAKNHNHAVFIEERFNINYPEYSGKFLRVIDNYEDKAQDLLEKFTFPDEDIPPQIAVSVDMMDTGVDAPRVVNLVFFKQVKSVTKFWQMIGRGTRLYLDLFGPGEDKENFLIFDFCENFIFFDENPDGLKPALSKSVSRQIFECKLEITEQLKTINDISEEDEALIIQYLDDLHQLIAKLDQNRFVVRKELRIVNEFTSRERWNNISKSDFLEICHRLSELPPYTEDTDELAKRFDLLILKLQLAIIYRNPVQVSYIKKISSIGKNLYKKKNIPAVSAQIITIKAVQTEEYWAEVSLMKLENARIALRELIKFIDSKKRVSVFTHFQDELQDHKINERQVIPEYTKLQSYKDRVESYIQKHKHHLTINKIRTNIPITIDEFGALENLLFTDSIGTQEEFVQEYGEIPLGKFIRSLLGLDSKTAKELFSEFIQKENMAADQITFINTIIGYLTKNGIIDKAMLFEPPFTDVNDQGITGVFDDADVVRIINIIDNVNGNAEVMVG